MNKFVIIGFNILAIMSCSSSPVKNSYYIQDTSIQTVGDLTRSSYLKGCVEALVETQAKRTQGIIFNKCLERAKTHEKEIQDIIKE